MCWESKCSPPSQMWQTLSFLVTLREQFHRASSFRDAAATMTLMTLPGSGGAMLRINSDCLWFILRSRPPYPYFVFKYLILKLEASSGNHCFDEWNEHSSDVCKFQTGKKTSQPWPHHWKILLITANRWANLHCLTNRKGNQSWILIVKELFVDWSPPWLWADQKSSSRIL